MQEERHEDEDNDELAPLGLTGDLTDDEEEDSEEEDAAPDEAG